MSTIKTANKVAATVVAKINTSGLRMTDNVPAGNGILFVGTWTETIEMPAPAAKTLPNVTMNVHSQTSDKMHTVKQRTAYLDGKGIVPAGASYHSCSCKGHSFNYFKQLPEYKLRTSKSAYYQHFLAGDEYKTCAHVKQLIDAGIIQTPERPQVTVTQTVTKVWTAKTADAVETRIIGGQTRYFVPETQCGGRQVEVTLVMPNSSVQVTY